MTECFHLYNSTSYTVYGFWEGKGGYSSHGGLISCSSTGAPWYVRPYCLRLHPKVLPIQLASLLVNLDHRLSDHICPVAVHNPLSWLLFKLFPHINSPFSNLSVKATPHIFSNSLHSHQTQRRDAITHRFHQPATHFEPAFSTFCRNPKFLSRITVCIPTTTKAAVLLWSLMLRSFSVTARHFCNHR